MDCFFRIANLYVHHLSHVYHVMNEITLLGTNSIIWFGWNYIFSQYSIINIDIMTPTFELSMLIQENAVGGILAVSTFMPSVFYT